MTLDALRRGDLDGARTLTLREGLTEFPPEIIGLADTLEFLDLSNNHLSELPADFGRLRRLRVLFCSNNHFERLPPSLGDCRALSQVGFRDTGLREIPSESLPPLLRWLTVTGNALETVPALLGEKPRLQKLMLSGNRLRALPESFAGAASLELLRLSANRFETLPPWISGLPRMAWLAWAGNPMDGTRAEDVRTIPWSRLVLSSLLGEGASGQVYRADWHHEDWHRDDKGVQPVAIKLFRGVMTSDGLPEREMEACLRAGTHPNLAGGIGRIENHPDGLHGLAMPLLPENWRTLAGPPSLESCTRDVYRHDLRLSAPVVLRLAHAVASAGAHLHAADLAHGDLYAHNLLWDGTDGSAVLGDFGASASLRGHGALRPALEGFDVLAWAILVGELLERCARDEALDTLSRLRDTIIDAAATERIDFNTIKETLSAVWPLSCR